jgi:hypothetical protein
MNLEAGILKLSEYGLNIFLSAKVSDIPADIFQFSDEQRNKTLCLIGHGGRDLWKNLPHPLNVSDHPIDQFCHNKMLEFATLTLEEENCEILFPNEHYILPLQKLGRFFNLSYPTPMGIDLCETYGVWFAFRGAFLTTKNIPEYKASTFTSPCTTCIEMPCLAGRVFCPINKEHQYTPAQNNYHASHLALIRC